MKPSSLTFGIIGAIACVVGAILFEVLFPARGVAQPENARVAIGLLIDTSGSMDDDGKLREVQRAASEYVRGQNLESNGSIAGMSVSRFSSDAQEVSRFSKNTGDHLDAISRFRAVGATEMQAGLETAAQSLFAAERNVTKIVLLFTDGEPGSNAEDPEFSKQKTLETAQRLRAQGVRLVAVGTQDANIGFLENLTGDRGLVFPTSAGNFAQAFARADATIKNLFSSGAGGSRGFLDALILGAFVTLALGSALLIAENTLGLRGRWWRDLALVMPMSAALGIGGALLGQILYAIFGDAARAVAWALVGGAAGAVLGIADRSPSKATRGAIGGAVGGFVGGLVFGVLTGGFSSGFLELLGRLIGFAVLGFAIGLMLQIVQQALKTAWLSGITTGPYEGKQYILGKAVVTVGRSDGNDIGLYREKTLALKAGAFKFEQGKWNYDGEPVQINGLSTTRAALSSGDTIRFGNTEFLFEAKGSASSPEPMPEPEIPRSNPPEIVQTQISSPPPIPSAPSIPTPITQVKSWRLIGAETLELPMGTVTLGRGEDNRVVIPDGNVSGHHAVLEVSADALFVTDLGSTNGTFADGKKIEPNTKTRLESGQALVLGALEFRVSS
jgi:uncharacterized protein YegL